mmetsp:Transcript_20875/g.62428  ORF Transcript_20875/g.62428 Transcript_20875/m.62428 type:complete len:119 (-) Transcript_20875:144-500(-)
MGGGRQRWAANVDSWRHARTVCNRRRQLATCTDGLRQAPTGSNTCTQFAAGADTRQQAQALDDKSRPAAATCSVAWGDSNHQHSYLAWLGLAFLAGRLVRDDGSCTSQAAYACAWLRP